MISLLLGALLSAHLGPVAPDTPVRQPQLAARQKTVALAFGAARAIYLSVSSDGGESFAAPVKVAEVEVLPLGRHRGPRIAFAGDAMVITAVAGNHLATGAHAHGLPADGDLLSWRSLDGGKTWSKPLVVNDVPAAAVEGLHGLSGSADGKLFAVWLDTRSGKGKQLYGAVSKDGGATWSKNIPIYSSPAGTICECCHPSAAIDGRGRLLVMWRNSLGGSRDMYAAASADGTTFDEPVKLGNGTWPLNACPMDGGALAASSGKVLTVWRRGGDIFLAEPGAPERQIGTGRDVALALSGAHVFAAWSDGTRLTAWVDGESHVLSGTGAFPSLCPLPGGSALAAWEENGGIQVRRLP